MNTTIQVLYEDNHLLIANKPSGMLVQKDKEGLETTLEDLAKTYIKTKYNKQGEVFLGIPHRIDRPTSGIVILCRTSKALVRINEMFQKKEIHKKYWAIISKGALDIEGHWVQYLKRSERENKTTVKEKPTDGFKIAELKYKIISTVDNYMLAEVELLTGRHHQIRAQFASHHFPIKGDVKYGARRKNEGAAIDLHARELKLIHPVSKEVIHVFAPIREDNLWSAISPAK